MTIHVIGSEQHDQDSTLSRVAVGCLLAGTGTFFCFLVFGLQGPAAAQPGAPSGGMTTISTRAGSEGVIPPANGDDVEAGFSRTNWNTSDYQRDEVRYEYIESKKPWWAESEGKETLERLQGIAVAETTVRRSRRARPQEEE